MILKKLGIILIPYTDYLCAQLRFIVPSSAEEKLRNCEMGKKLRMPTKSLSQSLTQII